jgi:hypothetical protein
VGGQFRFVWTEHFCVHAASSLVSGSTAPTGTAHLVHAYEINMSTIHIFSCGPGSVAGLATGYGLDGPGIEPRLGARFSSPIQTGPGAHPASCAGSFPGVESGRGVTLTSHPF